MDKQKSGKYFAPEQKQGIDENKEENKNLYKEEIVPKFISLRSGVEKLNKLIESNPNYAKLINKYIQENKIRRGINSDLNVKHGALKYNANFWLRLLSFLKNNPNESLTVEWQGLKMDVVEIIEEIKRDYFFIYERYYEDALKIAYKTPGFENLKDYQKENIAFQSLRSAIVSFKISDEENKSYGKLMKNFHPYLRKAVLQRLKKERDLLYYARGKNDELLKIVDNFIDQYQKKYLEKPSLSTVAEYLSASGDKITEKEIKKLLENRFFAKGGGGRGTTQSLDNLLTTDAGTTDHFQLNRIKKDNIRDPESEAQENQLQKIFEELSSPDNTFWNSLNNKAKTIFKDRLLDDNKRTLQEIADQYNVTRERIRQIENDLKKRIKKELERRGINSVHDVL